MPQTTYPFDPPRALAGSIVSRGGPSGFRGRYEANEDLAAGLICEYDAASGKLRLPQTAGASGKLLGGVPYTADMPNGGYKAAVSMVPVLRRGQMWCQYAGTAPSAETAVNVKSSSTIATDRGKVTADATSATAGSEVYALPGCVCIDVDTTLGLALIEFNLPA